VTSDDLGAIRHLLQNIRNADALRGNALVADMLPSLNINDRQLCEDVFNRVRRGIDALGQPNGSASVIEREIIRRCDLERTQHKVVIADLGISRRVFYYHRRRALRHLARHLRDQSTVVISNIADLLDEFEIHARRAASLAALGHVEAAMMAATHAEALATTPDRRVRAWGLLAEYAAETGHTDLVAGQLYRLEEELANIEHQADFIGTATWLQAANTSALLRWRIGRTDPLPAMRKIAAVAKSQRFVDAAAIEALARFLLAYADFANVGGAPVEARAILDDAGTIIRGFQEPSIELRVRMAIAEAVVSLALVQPLSYAADRAATALDLSVRNGLVPYALDASAIFAMAEMARGRVQPALNVVRAARSAAVALGPHEAAEFFFLSAARVCATAGALSESRSMLELAEQHIAASDVLAATQRFTRAVFMLANGRPAGAAKYAAEAMHLSERYDLKRMKGRALGVRAQALAALGRDREAHSDSIDAISVLERYGTQHTLASAYELSATLARERRYQRHAIEIRTAISS
jgi:hypothetical protein